MDTKVCLKWAKRTLTEFVKKNLERHVLLLDNLEAHIIEEFKEVTNSLFGAV